ncbi:MAG: sugar nucleotide-binding protein, partial [Desulfobulbaceae bacterium]|nr:sugar nucleotide-binding protein [Desulfobulbaceae bacterium]
KNFTPPEIVPIPTREYPTPAERPQNSVLDCGKIEEKLQIKPCRWEPGLISVINELLRK